MLHLIPALSDNDLGNGVCRYLINNLCTIYEERPIVCNVDRMYSYYFHEVMTKKEFIQINIEACKKISEYSIEGAVK